MSDEKDFSFIAKHYRRGSFSVDKAWTSLGITAASRWQRFRAAAVIAGVIVLSATAAIIYNHVELSSNRTAVETVNDLSETNEVVRIIDFENVSLPVVVDKIKDVYGVNVVNLPENAESYILSLRYEGTAEDLLMTINEILDTEMIIEK